MKSKKLLFLVIIFIEVIAVTGVLWYANKPANNQPEPNNQGQNEQKQEEKQNDSTKEQSKDKVILNINDIHGWNIYNNDVIGINFSYPDDWIVNEFNNKHKVLITNKNLVFRLLIHYPADPTGIELHELIKTNIFKTNDPGVDLRYELLKSIDNTVDSYVATINWTKKEDEGKNDQSGFIMISYSELNVDYYQFVIENIIKTFKFIK
ncbi:MAG: hypothetical protein ABIE43_00980 [Patescibacteria group bacterium]